MQRILSGSHRAPRSDDLLTVPISARQMADIANVYNSDPTIQACRSILSSVLSASSIKMVTSGGGRATTLFQDFIDTVYLAFVVEALDTIRMFGFVVYSLHRAEGSVMPYVVPLGTYTVEMAIVGGHRKVMRAHSSISNGGRQSALHVYMQDSPSIQGNILSPVAALAPKIMSLGLLLSAAVEGDLNAALPTLITQTATEKPNAAADIYSSSELDGFFGSHASDMLTDRAARANRQGVEMLTQQQEMGRETNAGGGPPKVAGRAYLNAGLLALPAGQQLVSPSVTATRQDIPRMREDLSRMVCSVLGVPLGLLDPSATSFHNESLTCKVFAAQLAKQARTAQKLLACVYAGSFKAKGPARPNAKQAEFTLQYQSFTAAEDIYAAYDREVVDEMAIRKQITRNLGMDESLISRKPRVAAPLPGAGATAKDDTSKQEEKKDDTSKQEDDKPQKEDDKPKKKQKTK